MNVLHLPEISLPERWFVQGVIKEDGSREVQRIYNGSGETIWQKLTGELAHKSELAKVELQATIDTLALLVREAKRTIHEIRSSGYSDSPIFDLQNQMASLRERVRTIEGALSDGPTVHYRGFTPYNEDDGE